MKNYEGMFLVDTREGKKNPAGVEEQIKGLIAKCGGEIADFEKWDERKLAYPIKGASNAIYFLVYFTGNQDTVQLLTRQCELSPLVLRALFLGLTRIPTPEERAGRMLLESSFEDDGDMRERVERRPSRPPEEEPVEKDEAPGGGVEDE